LNEHVVRLPPLRERKEDILQLARLFTARYGKPNTTLTFSFLVAMLHYDWPFNVRELESCIKRGVALAGGGPLDTAQLPDASAELLELVALHFLEAEHVVRRDLRIIEAPNPLAPRVDDRAAAAVRARPELHGVRREEPREELEVLALEAAHVREEDLAHGLVV